MAKAGKGASPDREARALLAPIYGWFTEGFETAHSRLDPASGVIAGPLLPVRPTEAPGRPEDVVTGASGWAVFLPQASVFADRDNGGAAAIPDGRVATPGVEGAVAGHGADLFIRWDLIQKVRQNGAVAFAA